MRLSQILFVAIILSPSVALPQDDSDDVRYAPEIVMARPTLRDEQVYVVQDGDTLWDLCSILFDDPWYWPTLWAYNPQITNPHWIFPGDVVCVRPREQEKAPPAMVWAMSRFTEVPRDVEILTRFAAFLPEKEYRESGALEASREEKKMLGEYDEAYVRFSTPRKIREGEELTIYRVDGPVKHPVTGNQVGYQVRHLGIAKVLSTEKPEVKVLITKAYEEIGRGDLVTEMFVHPRRLRPVRNEASLHAVVVGALTAGKLLGEMHLVFVDKGKSHGVQRGNRFVIIWRGDGYEEIPPEKIDDYPYEKIGEVIVVEPFENFCLALVVRSIAEIAVGQKLEMVKGF